MWKRQKRPKIHRLQTLYYVGGLRGCGLVGNFSLRFGLFLATSVALSAASEAHPDASEALQAAFEPHLTFPKAFSAASEALPCFCGALGHPPILEPY